MDDDRALVKRFLDGELDGDTIAALEERLDAEPELMKLLADMAKEAFDGDVPDGGATRVSRLWGTMSRTPEIHTGLELREAIAQGGMGVVHRARQRSVGRTVAVKTVHDRKLDAPLIYEAMVTGYLEHPNIVPVHEIVVGDDDAPLVVMKHIEGTVWRTMFADPHESTWRPLTWHVGVAIQICQALRFAHSRGIVHRDIKPDNVMIGEFDEVYLVDWGLAASLEEGSRLPNLAAQHGYAGTPAYMAPEQLADDAPERVGVHTDVYLVGASLYHAVTGGQPRSGESLEVIRQQALEQPIPPVSRQVAPELADIIRKAMAPEPTDRYESVAALKQALEGYLEHRASAELVARGEVALGEMKACHEARDAIGAERAFFEATFKFRAAHESWRGNRQALRRLDEVVSLRVEQLIARHAPVAARHTLALVDVADPELHAKVDRAVARQDKDKRRLRSYERGDDRQFGLMTRRLLGFGLGGIWIGLNVLVVALPVTSSTTLLVDAVVCLLISLGALYRSRRVMWDIRLNRYNAAMSIIVQIAQVLMLTAAAINDQPASEALIELLLPWAITVACISVAVDRRIMPTAIVYLVGYVLCRLDPAWLTVVLPVGAAVTVVVSIAINILTEREKRQAREAESRR